MRQTQFTRVIILSAELDTLTPKDNRVRTKNLKNCLRDLEITPHGAVGAYKNSVEHIVIAFPKDELEADVITQLALRQFGQDSVLYRGMNGVASLFFSDGNTKELGTLVETSMALARRHENYTVFNNKYYVTKG